MNCSVFIAHEMSAFNGKGKIQPLISTSEADYDLSPFSMRFVSAFFRIGSCNNPLRACDESLCGPRGKFFHISQGTFQMAGEAIVEDSGTIISDEFRKVLTEMEIRVGDHFSLVESETLKRD